jgi:hypothetical protein
MVTVTTFIWIIIAILFSILGFHSLKLYLDFEKNRKNGNLEVRQMWESNMPDIVKIFSECFRGLAISSLIACIISVAAALLPILGL